MKRAPDAYDSSARGHKLVYRYVLDAPQVMPNLGETTCLSATVYQGVKHAPEIVPELGTVTRLWARVSVDVQPAPEIVADLGTTVYVVVKPAPEIDPDLGMATCPGARVHWGLKPAVEYVPDLGMVTRMAARVYSGVKGGSLLLPELGASSTPGRMSILGRILQLVTSGHTRHVFPLGHCFNHCILAMYIIYIILYTFSTASVVDQVVISVVNLPVSVFSPLCYIQYLGN